MTTGRCPGRCRTGRRPSSRRPAPPGGPANHWGVKWALALATIALPAMIAGALITGNRDLFSSTTVALMAYILALLVAVANGLAARIEDDNSGKPGDQRRR